jgi:hypothetical protein
MDNRHRRQCGTEEKEERESPGSWLGLHQNRWQEIIHAGNHSCINYLTHSVKNWLKFSQSHVWRAPFSISKVHPWIVRIWAFNNIFHVLKWLLTVPSPTHKYESLHSERGQAIRTVPPIRGALIAGENGPVST